MRRTSIINLLTVFLFNFYLIFSTSAKTLPDCLLYVGPGTGETSVKQSYRTLKMFLSSKCNIRKINAEYLINEDFFEKSILLVIPGGADIPYANALNGIGNKKIQEFVKQGGNYLGICAGAYYAGNYVLFAKGTPLEVIGNRELGLFPGVVEGPTLAPYDYKSNTGARAANIRWLAPPFRNKNFRFFYNGGGHFQLTEDNPNIKILGYYSDIEDKNLPAILEIKYGKGRAILSGIHFEFDPTTLNPSEYPEKIIDSIIERNNSREEVVNFLLNHLITSGI